MRILLFMFLLLMSAGWVGWQHKARLLAIISPPPSAGHPAEQPDILYSWVDKDGVTHYEQDSGKGRRIAYDGSRITRLEPLPPEVLARATAEAEAEAEAETAKPKGSQALHALRNELQRNQQLVQQGRNGSGDL